jgi:hypothetical protein
MHALPHGDPRLKSRSGFAQMTTGGIMKRTRQIVLLAAGVIALPLVLAGQEATGSGETKPFDFGGFASQGSASFGYRFTDIKGYDPMYREMFDLEQGPRLMDFSLFGEAKEGAVPFADVYSLILSNLGGDPFPTAQLTVSKHRLFDFRVTWRQAYYFWNQNDNVILPIHAVAPTLTTGLTDNHDWDTVRKFGNANLTVHATDRLRFNFDYYRTTDDGPTFTTASPDFLGSPGYWGTYARANPFYLYAPIQDETNRFTGGIDYSFHSWAFHYAAGYQTFNSNMNVNNVTSPQLSIDPATSSTMEPLTSLTWSQFRRLTTPISEFSFVGRPLRRLQWRGSYLFYRYQGPVSFDQSFNGIAPNATGVLTPYAVSQSVRGNVTEPDHIISQGFTFDINSWWSANIDYRYTHQTSEGIGTFNSLFNATTPSTNAEDIVWRNNLSDLYFTMDFTPIGTLILRPGVHFMKYDVATLSGGVQDPVLSQTIKTAAPEISFGYEPSKVLSFRGDLHSFNNGVSYTAITPRSEVGGHAVVEFHPIPKFSLDNDLNVSNGRLLETDYRNVVRLNSTTASYALNERFSIFAGFSYEDFYTQGQIIYIRGTPPLNDFLRDQELNRVWQGGVDVKPTKHFAARLTGNFARSSGVGEITGEPPAYGPVTWPLVTGTLSYDFPEAGRLSIDLQRTYYIQDIVTVNNYSANLLTIRWTRDF